jgi:hypothetical protein
MASCTLSVSPVFLLLPQASNCEAGGNAASRPLQFLTLEVEHNHHQMEVFIAFLA